MNPFAVACNCGAFSRLKGASIARLFARFARIKGAHECFKKIHQMIRRKDLLFIGVDA